jgi:hypothetical protein
MTVQLTQPLRVDGRSVDFGGSEYWCPPRQPGLIVRGRARVSNIVIRRTDGPTAPCVHVLDGYRAHLSFVFAYAGQYGILVQRSEGTRLVDCEAEDSDLDGGKEIEHCTGTVWERGFYCGNGKSATQKGDGLDSYDGGNGTSYIGVVCSDNDGNGITYKTAAANTPLNGYQRDVEIAHVRCERNYGAGLALEGAQEAGATADTAPRPLASQIAIVGGVFNGNGWDGIVSYARDWTATGTQTSRNGRCGIKVGATARDWAIVAPIVIGNGTKVLGSGYPDAPAGTTGTRPSGIWVAGKRGRIVAPIIRGAHSDDVWQDSDLDVLTATQRHGVWCTADADDVSIESAVITHHLEDSIKTVASGVVRSSGEVLA